VRCSPARAVFVVGPDERAQRQLGQAITSCTLSVPWIGEVPYIRVTVVDDAGRKAWTNPIWVG